MVPVASVLLFSVVALALGGPWALFSFEEVHSVDLQLHGTFSVTFAVVGKNVVQVGFDGGFG